MNILCSLLLPAISIAIFYLLYVLLLSHIWEDQAFYLYAARQVLTGVKLESSRLIVVNPPLIVWFSEIPVAVAGLLHISPLVALRVVTLLFVFASTVWSARLVRIAGVSTDLGTLDLLLAAFVGVAELTIQPTMFGQREQFTLILLMPYVSAISTGVIRFLTTPERCAVGFCAGLAVCFKPQQVLILVCLELFLLVYGRTLRHLISTELIASVLTGIWASTPYLSAILPLLLDTYWAVGEYTWSGMLLHNSPLLTALLLFAVIGWLRLRSRMRAPAVSGTLLACAARAFIAFVSNAQAGLPRHFPRRPFSFWPSPSLHWT